MAKAKKLPSGAWRTQVYAGKDANGKNRYESFTAPTARESELLAAQFKASTERRKAGDMTVQEAIDGYISAKEKVLSPKTIREYKNMARTRYTDIGKKSVRKLTTEDLQIWISSMVGDLSPKSIANTHGLLASSVAFYAPDLRFPITLPKKAKQKQTAPSDEEIRALYEAADDEMKMCIALAAFGSLRRGEICGLKYKDLLKDGVYVHCDLVQDTDNNWILKEMPKTAESVRTVKLPSEVMELIGTGDPDEFIYPRSPYALSRGFQRLRKKLGLEHIRFHDLRHYFASIAAVLGIPQAYVADFGGWRKNSPVMQDVYQNKIIPVSDAYSAKLTDHFGKLIK